MIKDSTTGAGSAYALVIDALAANGSRRSGHDWLCPAHDDRHPSLTVKPGDKGALIYCHSGCEREEITRALGLRVIDLVDNPNPGDSERSAFLASLADVRHRAQAYDWKYRGGRTDRDVFLCAVLAVMERSGKTTVALSQREASELSGVTNRTASASLTRQIVMRILHEEPPRDRTRVFTLNPDLLRDCSFKRVVTIDTYYLTTQKNEQSRNFFAPTEWGVMMGKPAVAVWSVLSDHQGQTVTEVAAISGVDKGTVSKSLRFKLSPRWAVQRGKVWFRGEDDPMSYNPDEDSFAGHIVANRKARYAIERKQDRERRKVTPEPAQWAETSDADCCNGCGTGYCYPDCCPGNYPWRTDGSKTLCDSCYQGIGSEHGQSRTKGDVREIPGVMRASRGGS